MSNGRFRETIEGIGGCLLYIGFLLVAGFLVALFFKGAGWLASVVLPMSGWITLIAFALVPICLVLSIPRPTRGWGGLGLVICSYAIGLCLWLWCLVVAYQLAGMLWLIIGLFLAGVGVVLVATIASLIHGEWLVLAQIVIGVVIVYGLRILGSWLVEKSEPTDEYEPSPSILMMPKDAERIVQQYGAALARGYPDRGIARYASYLSHSRDEIKQASKLFLACRIEHDSLTNEVAENLLGAVMFLDSFVPDAQADRINQIHRTTQSLENEEYSTFISNMLNMEIREEMDEFIVEVEALDPNDPLFHQRIYTLAGLEYGPSVENGYFELYVSD